MFFGNINRGKFSAAINGKVKEKKTSNQQCYTNKLDRYVGIYDAHIRYVYPIRYLFDTYVGTFILNIIGYDT